MSDSWDTPAAPVIATPPPIEAPITWPQVVNRLIPNAALMISMILIGGFFYAYWLNWQRNDAEALNLMNGALIAGFAGAWGYWLGSSRGSAMKDQAMAWLSRRTP